MPLIYCQTERAGVDKFDLIHSYYIGASIKKEDIISYDVDNNNRLLASIVNIGMACRALANIEGDCIRIVGIESDQDGKDQRHGGEHDILYSLLIPSNDFAARKQRSLYHEYNKHLGRIFSIVSRHGIRLVLQDRERQLPRYN